MLDKINTEIIINTEDTLHMLDRLLEKWDRDWWNDFYKDREKDIPFFVDLPDENLVELLSTKEFKIKKSLDIGCGNGRNSIYLAQNGFNSTGIDISTESIEWANEKIENNMLDIKFINQSIFDFSNDSTYDLIHDSGCLHHIKPHRRNEYLRSIHSLLSDDGFFSLTCFNLKGGANLSDYEVYKGASMCGGLGYSDDKLIKVVEPYFNIIDIREMRECSSDEVYYGKDICLVVTMTKKPGVSYDI